MAAQVMPDRRERGDAVQIGGVTVDPVLDGEFVIDRAIPYPDVPAERWAAYEHLLRDGVQVVNQLGGYLIRSDDRVVLVDLGFGPDRVPTWQSGQFLDSLKRLGVAPDDVTDVLFTHLHFDHVGWAAVAGDPVFPRATHRCHERDWAYFTDPGYVDRAELLGPGAGLTEFPAQMRTDAKLGAISHLVKRWSGRVPILPGLEIVECPGHTPGTTAIRLTSEGESVMFTGDIAHHQAELVEPDWGFAADMDPSQAGASRRRFLPELADSGALVAGGHFQGFTLGRVVRTDTGFAWTSLDRADGR
jgi:glyoxylase-like metal-dependent hydrolase (beta-lactamase superfamily II)